MTSVRLPSGSRDSAVLLTRPGFSGLDFGYRLQSRFPGLLKGWWICASDVEKTSLPSEGPLGAVVEDAGVRAKTRSWIRDIARRVFTRQRRGIPGLATAEKRVFGDNIRELQRAAALHPLAVAGPHAEAVLGTIRRVQPYFLLLHGTLEPDGELLDAVCGVAISHKEGSLPPSRASVSETSTANPRQFDRIGTTLYMTVPSIQGEFIVRRTTATLHPQDGTADYIVAAMALGMEMLLDFLEEAIRLEVVCASCVPSWDQACSYADLKPEANGAMRHTAWAGRSSKTMRTELVW